ncbi:MAG: lipid II:glycine glycyltransferase FemX [Bacteroidales bacterium]
MHNIDVNQWTSFILQHPNGNIFQSPEFYNLCSKYSKYEPVVVHTKDNNSISGILLAVIQREHSGIIGRLSARSIIIGGPIIKNNDPKYLNEILAKYFVAIKGRAIYTQFRNLWDWSDLKSGFETYKFKYEEHLDILIDLTDINKLEQGISKNKKRNIIKSQNKGLIFKEIHSEKEYNDGISLILKTYKKIGLPCHTPKYFELAFKEFFPLGHLKTFGAFIDDKLIGVRMELIFKDIIYDWYAGTDDTMSNKYPNDFLIYNILLWGNENKFKLFDFGGAGKPNIPYGVREHKLKFSNNLVEFGRFEYIHKRCFFKFGQIGLIFYRLVNDIRK